MPAAATPSDDSSSTEIPQAVHAGPSAPARRNRRPSHTRRRSSSITAAVSLIRSYSGKQPSHGGEEQGSNDDDDDDDDDDDEALEDFAPTGMAAVRDANKAFSRGRPSPYHIAFLTLLGALASGMPLASLFVLYQHVMCKVYSSRRPQSANITGGWIPPSPKLPSPGQCPDSWVQPTTSSYTAAMATTGAVVSLILLQLASKFSARFGRKPVMLLAHLSIAAAFLAMRLAVLLPTHLGVLSAVLLFVSVVVSDASSGAPMRISVQNYIVDVTSESSRASAFSFVEGTGQIGGFPASTIGGWLAAGTGDFFAPFYACSALFLVASVYVLVFVPESKKHHAHTIIDEFERSEEAERVEAARRAHSSADSVHSFSTSASVQVAKTLLQRLQTLNFLRPLGLFLPTRTNRQGKRSTSYRLLSIALLILCEESYNVFILPILLLFNADQFGLSVVQNGYLVSLLQGARALVLTLVFPWVVRLLKERRARQVNQSQAPSESTRLLDPSSTGADVDHTRVDLAVMVTSYLFATLSFLVLASSRLPLWPSPWYPLIIGIVLLQCGSGSSSVRTALVVSAATWEAADTDGGGDAPSDQGAIETRALAANQVLATGVLATVPLLTSAVYGLGLGRGVPEAVWAFKAAFAGIAAVVTAGLWIAERRRR